MNKTAGKWIFEFPFDDFENKIFSFTSLHLSVIQSLLCSTISIDLPEVLYLDIVLSVLCNSCFILSLPKSMLKGSFFFD